MPVSIQSLFDNRVLLVEAIGDISKEELIQLNEDIAGMIEASEDLLHVIIDASAVKDYPIYPNVHLQLANWMRHQSLGWLVLVTNSSVAKMLVLIITHTFKNRCRLVGTREDAIEFLKRMDDRLKVVQLSE